MKKFLIIAFFLFLTGVTSFSQTKKTPVKTSATTILAEVSEISDKDWQDITKSLETENLSESSFLSSIALKKLKIENDKKQLAGLRYFYLYSLAGKVQAKITTYEEFERISQAFIGKDFLMPSRQVLADCTGKVNYVCAVKNDADSLRVTATNKSATSIYFFEYVRLDTPFDFSANNEKKVFVSGKLKKIESNLKNNMRIIRLFFEDGTVGIVK